jgi:hypothetical protein
VNAKHFVSGLEYWWLIQPTTTIRLSKGGSWLAVFVVENLQAELADKGRSSRVACHRHVIGGDTSQELSSVLIKSFRPFSTVAEINKDKR